MARFIIFRLLSIIPLVFVVSILVFLLTSLIPGSAADIILDSGATPEAVAALEAQLGLDRPLIVQYLDWITGILRGDFGDSWLQNATVGDLILRRIDVTISITIGGMIVGTTLGIMLGVISGLTPGSGLDRFLSVVTSASVAVPSFWLAIILAILFALQLRWFPAVIFSFVGPFENPIEWLRMITLPSIALGIPSAALIARQTRSSMTNVLQSRYILAAHAMGIPLRRVIGRHALRNALVPVITVIGFRFAVVIGSGFVVETIFGMKGIGELAVSSVQRQDIPAVQGVIMVTTFLVVGVNALVDISYAWLNPRIRLS